MAKPGFDRWIERHVARLRFGDFLHRAAETGAAFLFAFGAAVLIVKLLVPDAWPNILWGALGIVPAWAVAWRLARGKNRSRWESVARLDSSLESGGLLMMLSELPDEEWTRALPQFERDWRQALPRVRPRRFAAVLALPLVFALGACFVPLREAATATVLRNTVGQEAARELEALLESIDEEKVLDEQERQKLQEEVRKIAEETRDTPLTSERWEAVDALRERMRARLESGAMLAAQAGEAAAQLSALKAADPNLPEISLERREQLERDLADSLQKLGQKGFWQGGPQDLQERLERLTKNGKLQLPREGAEREELLDELREFLDDENRKLAELRKKCSGSKGCKSGECEGAEECEGGQCLTRGLRNSGRPGKGGVNRGRGDAELTWGDEADKQGVKFKEIVLPKGLRDKPKDEIIALQRTAPNEEAAELAPKGAARADEAAVGETTWNRKLSPRHRNVVRRYFDSAK